MPSQKQEFSFPGYTTEQLLTIAYGSFLELAWTPRYAGPNAIVGYTPRSWNKYDDEILVEATDGTITVTSSLVHNESFDMRGKNKKHINDFMTAFEKIKMAGIKREWPEELEKLRTATAETATAQLKQAEGVNEVMHFTSSNLYATYGIAGINVIVFILMAINGAGIFDANAYTHIRWGSNYTPLTLSGDWWRLVTCMFIHFGIIHLAMNTYALYMAGVYLEPMLGKTKFIVAYLCTGVFASLTSLWWHSEGVNSAGASGAIFGMYGIFLALLLTNLMPKQIRRSLLSSIGVFVVFNLVYGVKAGVDNAAHIGGLVSGAVIGFVFYPLLKKNTGESKSRVVLAVIASATIVVAWMYLNNPGNAVNAETRQAELYYLNEAKFPDGTKFLNKYNEFAEADGRIVSLLYDDSLSYTERINKNETRLNEEFGKAMLLINEMKKYHVSDNAKKAIGLVEQLLDARKENLSVIRSLAAADNDASQQNYLHIQKKEAQLVDELKKQLNYK